MSNSLYANLEWLPCPPADFTVRCRAVTEANQGIGAELRALATHALDQEQLDRLAKAVVQCRNSGRDLKPLVPFRLGILSNATIDFVIPSLVGTAARHGIGLEVIAGEFGQTMQQAQAVDSLVNRSKPDAVLIAIDYRGLPLQSLVGDPAVASGMVGSAVEQLEMIRSGIKQNSGSVCLLQTLAPPPESQFGGLDRTLPGTLYHSIQEVNAALLERLRGSTDLIVDVARLAETVGVADWYSPQEWNLAKLPFSDSLCSLYAEHVCRVIGALRGKAKRCLVLDLDNTIWGGIIGDDGMERIQVAEGDATGEAYRSVQRFALELRHRGIVLAVCSKNEDAIARLPFQKHPEMLLREQDIAVFQANWADKPTNIRAIAEELSLGVDSMVFLDDNPAERAYMRREVPEVAVPELPNDPALFARTLSAAGYFEAISFSREDIVRADLYRVNSRRIELHKQSSDLDSYLRSLKMQISFLPFDDTGRARITQLINKSNQYNLTTRRYTEAQVARMQDDPSCFTLQVRLSDAFGDNGMISVVICRMDQPGEWEIDTWLMSCRVLGRRVEYMVLKKIVEQAKKHGIRKIKGTYVRSDRNKLAEDHYPKLGFNWTRQETNGSACFELEVDSACVQDVPITVVSAVA